MAGSGDRLFDPEADAPRLHGEISGFLLEIVSGFGHRVRKGAAGGVRDGGKLQGWSPQLETA
ncbi:hypothetical protein NKH57_29825 [Mesorhizobium sp. M1050]|uniref:hypothetical protein n=1 Tax=Mesorhizobium sp. M1050 TaxID=2957051 RepID=UPI00333D1F34